MCSNSPVVPVPRFEQSYAAAAEAEACAFVLDTAAWRSAFEDALAPARDTGEAHRWEVALIVPPHVH